MQRLVRSAKGVVEEEASGNWREEDDATTEEDDADVEACWDGVQQVEEDWEGKNIYGKWISEDAVSSNKINVQSKYGSSKQNCAGAHTCPQVQLGPAIAPSYYLSTESQI